MKSSVSTPQDQWRARILLRSAEEADQGIGNNMKHHEQSVRNVNDPVVRASYQKLNRDYRRAHDSFKALSNVYNKYQQEAVAQLGGDQGWLSPEEVQRKMLAKQEVNLTTRKCVHRRHKYLANLTVFPHNGLRRISLCVPCGSGRKKSSA